MRVVVSGASGFIGTSLVPALKADGHDVVTLVRRSPLAGEIRWDPTAGHLDPADLSGVDAAIHLAGASIADHRWTAAYRRTILESRTRSTELLSRALVAAGARVLLSGSAIGFYGDTGDREVDETDGPGSGFLTDTCAQWEAAAEPAVAGGLRVCLLRTGIVLDRGGGALAKQLPLFRVGLGGRLGSGRQWMSWITLADEVAAIKHLLASAASGPVNLTAPGAVRQRDFARALGRALRRPAVAPVPGLALRAVVGGFAREGILAGQRVLPAVLLRDGFRFASAGIDEGLAAALHLG